MRVIDWVDYVKSLASFGCFSVELFEGVEATLRDFLNLSWGEYFSSIFIESSDKASGEDSGFDIKFLVEWDFVWGKAHYYYFAILYYSCNKLICLSKIK